METRKLLSRVKLVMVFTFIAGFGMLGAGQKPKNLNEKYSVTKSSVDKGEEISPPQQQTSQHPQGKNGALEKLPIFSSAHGTCVVGAKMATAVLSTAGVFNSTRSMPFHTPSRRWEKSPVRYRACSTSASPRAVSVIGKWSRWKLFLAAFRSTNSGRLLGIAARKSFARTPWGVW